MFTFIFLILCTLVKIGLGLENNQINSTLDFFLIKNVKSVCSLACADKNWDLKFAKRANNLSISFSSAVIKDFSNDSDSVISCLDHQDTTGVVIDTKCPAFEDILLLASENSFFDANHQWLITHDDGWTNITDSDDMEKNANFSRLKETFSKLNLSIDADITLSLQKGDRNDIYEVFNFGKIRGSDVIISKLGSWTESPDLLSELTKYKYYRRWDFQQSSINLVAVMTTPPKEFDINLITGNQDKKGVAIITVTAVLILEELKELHNIRFNYTILDRWVGGFERNSTKVVVNSLYFKEQDLTPVLRMLPETFQKLDMLLLPLTSVETRFYYRIPTSGPGKLENQFLRPLTTGAWRCVTAVTVLCSFMLFLAAKAERRPTAAQYAVFSVLATFCQQSRQLAVLVTGASCVLIYNYYTSSVVSWLLNGPPPSINSLEELLESPLSLIFEDIGYTRSWLTQNPTYYYNKKNAEVEDKLRRYKVFNKKKGSPLFVPLEQGIEMVKAGGYAYHTEVYNANTLISKIFTQEELCELGSLQSIDKTPVYVTIPKNSSYKEFFNWNVIRFAETGIVSRFQQINKNPEIACGGSSPRALALGGASPAFILLALGYVLSVIILLMERFMKRNNVNNLRGFKFVE